MRYLLAVFSGIGIILLITVVALYTESRNYDHAYAVGYDRARSDSFTVEDCLFTVERKLHLLYESNLDTEGWLDGCQRYAKERRSWKTLLTPG